MIYFFFYICKYLVAGKSVIAVLIYVTANAAIWKIKEEKIKILLAKKLDKAGYQDMF